MAKKKETDGEELVEEKKRSPLIPVILGAVLVIGASAGVVVMTAPPAPEQEEEVLDYATLPSKQWAMSLSETFNPLNSKNSICKLSYWFEYKAPDDPLLEQQVIQPNLRKAQSEILIFLKGMTKEDLEGSSGAQHIRKKIKQLLNESIFPSGKGIVSDVFIKDLLFT